jgi:hypothetical protein
MASLVKFIGYCFFSPFASTIFLILTNKKYLDTQFNLSTLAISTLLIVPGYICILHGFEILYKDKGES